jgi:hypothetical protein
LRNLVPQDFERFDEEKEELKKRFVWEILFTIMSEKKKYCVYLEFCCFYILSFSSINIWHKSIKDKSI